MSRTTVLLLIGYVAVTAAAVFGVAEARRATIASQTTVEAQADWDAWRANTEDLSKSNGPMKRRPAKAAEQPMLILLRDHFGAVIGSTIVGVTMFYWFLAFLVRGSMNTPAVRGATEPEIAA